jgi:hypothetical protein
VPHVRPSVRGTKKMGEAQRSKSLREKSEKTLDFFILNSPQRRHPERSASRTYRVTLCLERGVEGPRRCLSDPCCSELFNHRW